MGQTLKTLSSGDGGKRKRSDLWIIGEYYDTFFDDIEAGWTPAEFYRVICRTIEKINEKHGSMHLRVPSKAKLEAVFKHHNLGEGRTLTKEEFQKVLGELAFERGFTGVGGAKDFLIFIFGVPAASLLIKQKVAPKSVSNGIFIPAVTSATVFVLAQLNKI